jgi:hypothetical protein
VGGVKDVVVDVEVVSEEVAVLAHVFKEATDKCSEVDDVGGLVSFKESEGLVSVSVHDS